MIKKALFSLFFNLLAISAYGISIAILPFASNTSQAQKTSPETLHLQWSLENESQLSEQIIQKLQKNDGLRITYFPHIQANDSLAKKVKLAKLYEIDYIVMGTVNSFDLHKKADDTLHGILEINLQILDIEKNKVILSKNISQEILRPQQIPYAYFCKHLTQKTTNKISDAILSQTTATTTVVSSIESSHIFINPQNSEYFQPGTKLEILVPNRHEVDSITGNIFGETETCIGQATVTQMLPKNNLIQAKIGSFKMPIPEGAICKAMSR